jgi:hypothetical protein
MAGTPRRIWSMFERLCGPDALQNVILTTTMWDSVKESVGLAREEVLRTKCWKSTIDANSHMARFYLTHESAWDIICRFTGVRRPLRLQVEMVDEEKTFMQTAARSSLYGGVYGERVEDDLSEGVEGALMEGREVGEPGERERGSLPFISRLFGPIVSRRLGHSSLTYSIQSELANSHPSRAASWHPSVSTGIGSILNQRLGTGGSVSTMSFSELSRVPSQHSESSAANENL